MPCKVKLFVGGFQWCNFPSASNFKWGQETDVGPSAPPPRLPLLHTLLVTRLREEESSRERRCSDFVIRGPVSGFHLFYSCTCLVKQPGLFPFDSHHLRLPQPPLVPHDWSTEYTDTCRLCLG